MASSHAAQTAHLHSWTDSADALLAWITAGGKVQTNRGVRATANQGGDSFAGWGYGQFVPEHSGLTGTYDATGGAFEKLLTATAPTFTQADADNRNWVVIQSGAWVGAKAEIDEFVDASNVTLLQASWDTDLVGVTFSIYPAPLFAAKNYFIHAHMRDGGQFHISNVGGGYDGVALVDIEATIGADGSDGFHIDFNAAGYSNADAQHIFYQTGDLQAGDENQVFQVSIDESGATGGHVVAYFAETTNASAATKEAYHVGVGFDVALHVSGAPPADPTAGYENTTDRVNGVVGDGNAFLEAGNDLPIWDNVNEYILLGDTAATFEVMQIILATPASLSLAFTWWYSQANGVWVQFFPDDATQNGTKSGLVDWDADDLAGWAKSDSSVPAAGDLLDAYYIKVVRTRVGDPPTMPVEDYFKLYDSQATGMNIRGDGIVTAPYLAGAPADLVNGMSWLEADGLHIYYGGAEKLVAGV